MGWRRADATRLPFRDGWFDTVHAHLVLHLVDDGRRRSRDGARTPAPGGRLAIGTFAPEHFREFFLNPYFPSIPAIDLGRFPDPDELCDDLERAGFSAAAVHRLDQDVTADAADVLDRVRGRYISTLRLLDPEEYDSGLARLEADVAAGMERFDLHAALGARHGAPRIARIPSRKAGPPALAGWRT